jgi:hypothetical protein
MPWLAEKPRHASFLHKLDITMSMTISAASLAPHIPPIVAAAPKAAEPTKSVAKAAAAPASSGSTSASAAQEKSALNQLLAKYKADLARGMAPGTLTGLGRQIMAAAKAAGQNVPTLPRAQVSAAAAAPPPAANTASGTGLNVTV